MTGGIAQLASGIADELRLRLPGQRKTQREALALLVATMLEARTANLMTLAAFLPRNAARADMRYQWIARFIDNHRVDCDAVMEPFARAALAKAAERGRVVLIMDQTKASERHQVLMLAVRCGERALPLAWRVAATQGAIGFTGQKTLLDAVTPWLPSGVSVVASYYSHPYTSGVGPKASPNGRVRTEHYQAPSDYVTNIAMHSYASRIGPKAGPNHALRVEHYEVSPDFEAHVAMHPYTSGIGPSENGLRIRAGDLAPTARSHYNRSSRARLPNRP